MKELHSAGGIIIRNINGSWHVLLIRDRSGTWTFPKGLLHNSESPVDAARREIQEEVGIRSLHFVTSLGDISYTYRANDTIQKTVSYFLFVSDSDESLVCQKEEGIREALFIHPEKALTEVGYKDTNIPLLQQAISLFPTI